MPRPRSYDETTLLDTAMQMFWSRGFEQTSISELVAETGVNRASLYAAYPDKRALFLASVQHYLERVSRENVERLRSVQPAAEAVRGFFLDLAGAPPRRAGKGCLLTNSAVEFGNGDPEISRLVRRAFSRMERVLAERLTEARQDGQLAPGVEPAAYARQLVVLIQGLRVMARVGAGRQLLMDAVESALQPLR